MNAEELREVQRAVIDRACEMMQSGERSTALLVTRLYREFKLTVQDDQDWAAMSYLSSSASAPGSDVR